MSAFSVFLIVAGGVILISALLAVAMGANRAFREGSPSGAMAMMFGLIVIAVIVGAVIYQTSLAEALSSFTPPPAPPTFEPVSP